MSNAVIVAAVEKTLVTMPDRSTTWGYPNDVEPAVMDLADIDSIKVITDERFGDWAMLTPVRNTDNQYTWTPLAIA